MPLASCVRCNHIFDKIKEPVCPKCQPDEDKDYDKIREVLDQNPNLNCEQVAAAADVDVACVTRMLDQGFIANVSMSDAVECGICGAPAISPSKKICQACLEKTNARIAIMQSELKLKDKKELKVGEFLQVRKTLEGKRR